MLDFVVQQYPFRYGLAEGVEPHQAPPGTLVTAENVVWKKDGRLEKRLGTSRLVATILGGGSISSASRLFARGTELCLIDATNLYAYSPTSANWRTVGKVPNVGLTSSTILDTVGGIGAFDFAISAGGLRVDAWLTGAESGSSRAGWVQVTDVADGTVLVAPISIWPAANNCFGIRVVITGTTAIIVSELQASTAISAATINLSTLAVSATTNLRTDVNAGAGRLGWDVCLIGSNMVLCYTNTAPALKLYSYNTSLVQQATGGITGEVNGADLVSIDGAAGEVLYVLYRQGALATPVRIAIADPSTLAQTVAPVTIEAPGAVLATQVAVCRYDATNCIAAYTMPDTNNVRVTTYQITSGASVTTSTQRGTYGTNLLTRPFMFGGACYLALNNRSYGTASSVNDRDSVLVEVEVTARTAAYTPHRYIGRVDMLIAGGVGESAGPCNVASVSSTSMYLPMPFQSATSPGVVRQGIRLVNITLGASLPVDMWRSLSYGQESFVQAGILSSYDGRLMFDYGFPRGPTFFSLTLAAGGSFVAGTYLYGAVLEYRSATGMLYRSPTQTSGGTVSPTVNQKCTIITEGYNIGNKQTTAALFGTNNALPTLHAWYRTTVNGTVYQRLTVDPTYNSTYIDQETDSVSFADTTSDANIGGSIALATRPALYTAGGILDDYAPPGGVTAFHHVDRLWALATDQRTWWYSKAFQDDLGTAPGFHPNLRVAFEDVQTAGASMDDKAIFFSATGIKYMLGTGPAPTGLNSDFQTPTTIQSDVGCTNARSVVSTPDGVMFLSDRGIYLLDRGLNLSWIGRQVKDTLAAFPNVTSAVLVAKQNQVRFTCNNTGGTAGCTLVYDYVARQWTTFRHVQGVSGANGIAIADACMWNGAWTFATTAGRVYVEDTSSSPTYLDNAAWVPITLETSWIVKPASQVSPSSGPLAFQSVREFAIHGVSNTDHDLTIQVGFDSETAYVQSVTWLGTSDVTAVGSPEDAVITIGTRRKCNAIRFKINDASPTTGTLGTGQGPSFDMMALEVGTKRGTGNTPATRKG